MRTMMKPIKIYARYLEPEAQKQFNAAMALPCNVQGALMPDAHTGYTLPIGAVIKSKEMVFPSYVGYDIGCGMCAIKLDIIKDDLDLSRIKNEILNQIPLGIQKHANKQAYTLPNATPMAQQLFEETGAYQLGTLGGGNHFIEMGMGYDENVWVVIHSGSRGFGKKIAEYYMLKAIQESIDEGEIIKEFALKNQQLQKYNPTRYQENLQKYISKQKLTLSKSNIEAHVGFSIYSELGKEYLLDMECALAFALENRKRMIEKIVAFLGNPKELLFINRNHNHAQLLDEGYVVHRKGATHANKDMLGVVPGNMRDGSFIVRGKGNKESLCSSSHGAGRVLSRKKALSTLSLDEFHQDMQKIVSNHTNATLDESPQAYKNIFEVMDLQKDLVEIIDYVVPFLNIKG